MKIKLLMLATYIHHECTRTHTHTHACIFSVFSQSYIHQSPGNPFSPINTPLSHWTMLLACSLPKCRSSWTQTLTSFPFPAEDEVVGSRNSHCNAEMGGRAPKDKGAHVWLACVGIWGASFKFGWGIWILRALEGQEEGNRRMMLKTNHYNHFAVL